MASKRVPSRSPAPVLRIRTAIYCRSATSDQVYGQLGLSSQEKIVQDNLTFRNSLGLSYQVERVYEDVGSAMNLDRPGLQALLAAVKEDRLDAIFVTDIARLTRSLRGFAEIWDMLRSHHCKLICVQESIDTSQSVFASMEKELHHA